MGLLRAGLGAAGGVMADQWKEFIYCESMPADVLACKGSKRTGGRSSNTRGEDNVISNGSVIAVNDGQGMLVVQNGKIIEVALEPGEFVFDTGSEPSVFSGNLGDSIKETFANIGSRFTFGGDAGKDQRVYFINTKEIIGNKYGTASPVPFRVVDNNIGLDVDISVRCNGEYSYRITNPLLFYTNVCGNVTDSYTRDKIDSQLKSELLTALQPAFAKISEMGIRYSAIPGHTTELARALNEVLSADWRDLRGVEIVSFGVNSIAASQADEQMIKDLQKAAVMRDPTMAAANIASAQSDAMRAAAANPQRRDGRLHGHGHGGRHGRHERQPAVRRRPGTAAGRPTADPATRPRTGSCRCPRGRHVDLQLRCHQHRQVLLRVRQPRTRPGTCQVVLPQLRQRKRRQVLQQLRNAPALAPLSGNWRGIRHPRICFYGFSHKKEDTMKTTFKKSVLAFLTCVLALAFALTGCSGGGKDPKANFVGSWELSGGTLEGEELTDEYMKMLEDWGVHCVLILDEDGTGALDLFLEVVDLKWEAKDATTVTITAEDESHDMKLKDGKLILEEDDGNLVFTKSDKDLSGTVKKDREAAEKEEEIDEAVEDDDVQKIEISPAVTVADDDLCTITITEKFKDDWGDIGFVVNITNKSDKDLTFYAPSGKTNVNGTMKDPWFSAHLMPGTNATEEFTFSNGELDSLDDLVNTTIGIDAYLTDSYEDVASYSATIA